MPRWRGVVIAGKGGLLAVLGRIWPGRARQWLPLPAREIFVANHSPGGASGATSRSPDFSEMRKAMSLQRPSFM